MGQMSEEGGDKCPTHKDSAAAAAAALDGASAIYRLFADARRRAKLAGAAAEPCPGRRRRRRRHGDSVEKSRLRRPLTLHAPGTRRSIRQLERDLCTCFSFVDFADTL